MECLQILSSFDSTRQREKLQERTVSIRSPRISGASRPLGFPQSPQSVAVEQAPVPMPASQQCLPTEVKMSTERETIQVVYEEQIIDLNRRSPPPPWGREQCPVTPVDFCLSLLEESQSSSVVNLESHETKRFPSLSNCMIWSWLIGVFVSSALCGAIQYGPL